MFDCIGMYICHDRLDSKGSFPNYALEQSARQLKQDLVQKVRDPCLSGDIY
jgi:hypothetical protein